MDRLPVFLRHGFEQLNRALLIAHANTQVTTTRSGKTRSPSTLDLRMFNDFVLQYEPHLRDEIMEILLKPLIENNQCLTDWEAMTDLLLEEPGENEVALTYEQETSFVELMVWCVHEATTYEAPLQPGTNLGPRELELQQKDKKRITEHFLQVLPLLLNRYRTDDQVLINDLLLMPGYFDLNTCAQAEQEKNLDLLLDTICDILSTERTAQVFDVSARTLRYLCISGSIVFAKCNAVRHNLIEGIVNKHKESITSFRCTIDRNEQPREDQIIAVVQSMNKVASLSCLGPITTFGIWNSLFEYITKSYYILPDKARVYCIYACKSILCTQNKILIKNAILDNRYDEEEVEKLEHQLRIFMDSMGCLIDLSNAGAKILNSLVTQAFVATCDILCAFNNRSIVQKNSPYLLCYEPNQIFQNILFECIQKQVFNHNMDPDEDFQVPGSFDILQAYCELIEVDRIPTNLLAHIFKELDRFGEHFADLICRAVDRMWSINSIKCALAIEQSLNMLYTERVTGHRIDRYNDFNSIVDLAKGLIRLIRDNGIENTAAITMLHQSGICFATSFANGADTTGLPMNYSYLIVLGEFSYGLIDEYKIAMANSITERTKTFFIPGVQNLQPLNRYLRSLYINQRIQ